MNKTYQSFDDFNNDINELTSRIQSDGKCYDAIIAIARGGITISHFLANRLGIKDVLNITASSYDNESRVSDVKLTNVPGISDKQRKGEVKLLIVDDISDTGETFKAVVDYFSNLVNVNVETLSLFVNKTTSFIPDYYAHQVDNEWIVFCWDNPNE